MPVEDDAPRGGHDDGVRPPSERAADRQPRALGDDLDKERARTQAPRLAATFVRNTEDEILDARQVGYDDHGGQSPSNEMKRPRPKWQP